MLVGGQRDEDFNAALGQCFGLIFRFLSYTFQLNLTFLAAVVVSFY